MEEFLAIVCFFTSAALFFPQGVTAWKNRNNFEKLQGVTTLQQLTIIGNSLAWISYGVVLGNLFVAAPSFFALPIGVFTLFTLLRLRVKQPVNTTVRPVSA